MEEDVFGFDLPHLGETLKDFHQGVIHGDAQSLAVLCLLKRDEPPEQVHLIPFQRQDVLFSHPLQKESFDAIEKRLQNILALGFILQPSILLNRQKEVQTS